MRGFDLVPRLDQLVVHLAIEVRLDLQFWIITWFCWARSIYFLFSFRYSTIESRFVQTFQMTHLHNRQHWLLWWCCCRALSLSFHVTCAITISEFKSYLDFLNCYCTSKAKACCSERVPVLLLLIDFCDGRTIAEFTLTYTLLRAFTSGLSSTNFL